MSHRKSKYFSKLESILLLTGVAATTLVVDAAKLQPFRDEKEALFIWIGGALALIVGLTHLWKGIDWTPYKPLLCLLPIWAIALTRVYLSTKSHSHFGRLEPGFPAETDYVLRGLAYSTASLPFWFGASRQTLSHRRAHGIGFLLTVLAGLLTVGVAIEIVGDRFGYDWRPFLLGAFVAEDQGALKTYYFGSFGNSNFLAGYLAVLSYPVLAWGISSKGYGGRLLGILLFFGMGSIVVLCRSKGAFAGFALAILVFLGIHFSRYFRRRDRRLFPMVGSLTAVGVAIVIIIVGFTLGSEKRRSDLVETVRLRGESLSQRILLAYVGLQMWEANPWLGIGPGQFRLEFLEEVGNILESEEGAAFGARVERLKSFKPVHVHNEFLEVLIEWGVVGYLSYAAFLVVSIWIFWRRLLRSSGPVYWFRLGAFAGVVAGLGYAVFEFPLHLASHVILMAFLLGCAIATDEMETPLQAAREGGLRFLGIGLGALWIAISVFLLWNGVTRAISSRMAGEAARLSERDQSDRMKARRLIQRAAQLDPGNGDLNRLEALMEWKIEHRPEAAIASLRRGARISDDPLFELMEAMIHLEKNRFREAAEAISPLHAVAPYLPGMGYLEGRFLESQGNLEKATEAYARDEQATLNHPDTKHPDLPHLYLRYGSVLERLGHYREAVWKYEKIAGMESDKPLALLRLGRIYRDRLQDLPTAESYFERALQSAERTGASAEVQEARNEILQLKKMREQMREEAILIESPEDRRQDGE